MRVSGLVTTIRLYICACIGFGYNHKVVYVRVSGELYRKGAKQIMIKASHVLQRAIGNRLSLKCH